MEKEEYAIILEYLPNGYPLEGKMMPIAQAIGEETLILLELVSRKGTDFETGEKVYIGQGKRDKVYYILGRLEKEKLTETAKNQIQEIIEKKVAANEPDYIQFFNKSEAINKKIHQIELLPGFGRRHMQDLLKEREVSPFLSFEDMKKRIPNLPDPKKAIERRIFKELTSEERYNLFIKQN